jgi:sugar phosphate permease
MRGRAIGIIGTGYQLCGALTFVLAGWAAERFGWRGALYVPSALLVASAAHLWWGLKEQPEAEERGVDPMNQSGRTIDLPLPGGEGRGEGEPSLVQTEVQGEEASDTVWQNILITLANPALWLVAISLCLLDACRYGFTDWGVTHLQEVQSASVSSAAFKYAVLPLGGMAGAYLSGLVSDRFFRGRRAPVICVLLVLLGLLAVAYNTVIHWGLPASVTILFLLGFCIFGPQVLLVGTFPVDLARRGTAAAAAGFVNFMGYMGAAAGDKLTGHLAQDYGWRVAVWFWAGCAFAAALVIACLWNAAAGNERGPAPTDHALLEKEPSPRETASQTRGNCVS